MKKIVQFLFVSVMILFVGLPARAQALADGNYYIMTADGQAYLGPSNDWGTHASLVPYSVSWKLVKVSEGVYTLESHVSNGGSSYFLNGSWCDSGSTNLYFTAASGSTYYISTAQESNYLKKGNNGYCNFPLVDPTEKKEDAIEWKVVPCIADGTGTLADGENVTYLIKCADFGRNNRDRSAWTVSADCTNKNLDGGANENKCAESWHSTFTINQVLNVPNGYYKLSGFAFYRQDGSDNDNLPVLYGNDKTVTFPLKTGSENSMNDASASFAAGNYAISTDVITVTDHTLEVGVKNTSNGTLWCIWDNFNLQYIEALDAPVRREMTKAAKEGDELWAPANTEINKLNKDYPNLVIDYEYASTVLGEDITVANAMYKANQDLVAAKDMIEAKYAEGEGKLYAAKDDIQALINEAKALIAEAQAQAADAYALAKDLAEVGKALPAGGYYLQNTANNLYFGYAGGDRGSKAANSYHPVEWTFAAVSKYGAYTFESAVADGDKYYFDGTVADGEETTIYISKADGYDAKNPTFVLALGMNKKYLKADYSTSNNKADAAVWSIKSTALNAVKAGDVTYLIKDANFDSNRNQAAWSFNNDKGEGGNDGNLRGGKKTNFCAETYKSAFTLHQKLTGIPNGYYTVQAQGATSKEFGPMFTANNERFFFAVKGDEDNLDKMSDAFATGKYVGKVEVHVTDGTLEIGAQNDDKSLWVAFDDFALYYLANDSSAYNAQVGDSVLAEWNRLDAKYNKIAAEGDPQFDVDAKGKAGAIRAQIDLIKSNTETKEITVKDKDGKDVKKTIGTGNGIDQLAASADPALSFVTKPVSGGEMEADSLYAKMAGVSTLLDNYKENAAARDELNKAIAELKTFWQAVYDLGNVRYGDVAKDYTGEFADQVAEFRGDFEENLLDLNDIDLAIDGIADKVSEYFFAGTVVNKVDEIKAALAVQKTNIEDELGEIQAESKEAVDAAAAEKIAIYDAAITVINQHYADKHEEIAKETNDKLFEIHKQIVKIQGDAELEYSKDVVKANNDAIAAKQLPTAAFGYATYLKALEDVRTDLIQSYLDDADAAALAENDDLVDDYTYGFYDEKGKLVSDGLAQLKKKFSDAIGRDAVVSDAELDAMKENKDGQYYGMIQEIATDLVAMRDTLAWYDAEAHTQTILGGVDVVDATFAAPTGITWDATAKTFSWTAPWGNQLHNIGLPNGDITNYKKVVVDCDILAGSSYRIMFYATNKGTTAGGITVINESGKKEFNLADFAMDADYLTTNSEFCLSGNGDNGTVKVNAVYFETYPDPEATKDTIICIFDAVPFLDALIADNQAAIDELAEIVEFSDEKKAILDAELSELRATWNKAKVGLIEVDPEVAAEDGLQKAYEQIDAIDTELKAPDFYYDAETFAKREAEILSATLRLSDYDAWVEEYTLDGDLNVDGDVTVTDVLIGIQYNLGNAAPQSKQEKYAAYVEDWKKADAKVDAVRLMEILNIALGETYEDEEEEDEVAAKARVKAEDLGQDYLVKDGTKMNLVNATQFYMFEMDVTVADGSTLEATLGERASKLNLYTSDLGNGKYHLLAMSLKKAAIANNEGVLFELNNENVIFSDITFVDGKAKGYVLDVVNASDIETGEADGIADVKAAIANGSAAIYTANGAQVANLQKGVNIVKFTNGSVRKIFVK